MRLPGSKVVKEVPITPARAYDAHVIPSSECIMTMKQCVALLRRVKGKGEHVHHFLIPVDHVALGLPDYPKVIKRPMDLGTIQRRLDAHRYQHPSEFVDDMRLVWSNAVAYNKPASPVHAAALHLREIFERSLFEVLGQPLPKAFDHATAPAAHTAAPIAAAAAAAAPQQRRLARRCPRRCPPRGGATPPLPNPRRRPPCHAPPPPPGSSRTGECVFGSAAAAAASSVREQKARAGPRSGCSCGSTSAARAARATVVVADGLCRRDGRVLPLWRELSGRPRRRATASRSRATATACCQTQAIDGRCRGGGLPKGHPGRRPGGVCCHKRLC